MTEDDMTKITHKDIQIIEIIDPYEYSSLTQPIASIVVKDPKGEIKRKGKFTRTKRGGYMFQ
jgi:hypothetical protein